MNRPAILSLAAALALTPAAAVAHTIYIAQRLDQPTVVMGHGASDESYDPRKVESVRSLDAAGADVEAKLLPGQKNVAVEAIDAALISVFFNEGYWTEGPEGEWTAQGKTKVPGAKSAGRYANFAVAHLRPLAAYPTAIGNRLEIVPLADPFALKAGGTLPVQLLFDGKPLAGTVVVADYVTDPGDESIKTDGEGRAKIPVRNNGLNVLNAYHGVKTADDPDADEHGFSASLSFTLSPEE